MLFNSFENRIEHININELPNVISNILNVYRPLYFAVTTPNHDFNLFFENSDPSKLRHWDHRFEFTREEFKFWCSTISREFGYSYEISGVGHIEDFSDLHGFCTQCVLFTNQNPGQKLLVDLERNFTLVHDIKYPHGQGTRPELREEQAVDCLISSMCRKFAETYISAGDVDLKYGEDERSNCLLVCV